VTSGVSLKILSVRGLKKSFGGISAVSGVDLSIAEGELLALIGPNGAGKTTFFNMLNGQILPDGGEIMLQGRNLYGLPPREIWRLGVGRTFQITQTFSSMTVLENVQLALLSLNRCLFDGMSKAHHIFRDDAMALLARVGMSSQADRGCGVLAYGDLKRVELAIALANRPKLLLMDEPTAGMAPKERLELMSLTASIVRERQVAVLFTEHDMDIVFRHADQIVVLNRGTVIARGRPEEVRDDPKVREVYLGSGRMFH
jgi:branched-chain amino acid transport system ATP-binding protein